MTSRTSTRTGGTRTGASAGTLATVRTAMAVAAALFVLLSGCGGSNGSLVRPPILTESEVNKAQVTVAPLDGLNSAEDDFGATMPLDSTIIFFTSLADGEGDDQAILYSRKEGPLWGRPKPAVEVNRFGSNGVPSISAGGTTMYFAGDEYGFGDCDLYRVDVGPRGAVPEETIPWSVPTNLGLRVNGTYWDSEPCISADGSVLYFASDRPGGFGGRDIWACRRRDDGTWDSPLNAGEAINTTFDEVTPWLSPDGQTLFFSSNGHPGLGGFDAYTATTVGGFTLVEHLGTPINSSADDICFSVSADGRHAFMASNRRGGKGGLDIYQVHPFPVQIDPLMIVRGTLRGKDSGLMPGMVEVTDLTSDQSIGSFLTDPETGEYAIVLPRGYNYAITAQAPGYLFNSKQLLVPRDLERDAEQRMDFSLEPIGGVVRLLVFFETNQSNLQRESRSDLDRTVAFMRANPGLTVEIAGHTDSIGDPKTSLTLSRERAQAVKSYLVGNRIEADRIKVVGYGAAQPIAGNDTEEGRAMNRRVEMRIIEAK
jgi:outer membrane protein OmpA-like peptidoglycan-associated protein